MKRYWDRRAREDAFHFVDSRQARGRPDTVAFWEGGEEVVEGMFSSLDVGLEGHETVLDIGCGLGRVTRALAGRAQSVLALDVSEEMLRQARDHNDHLTNVSWLHGDGQTLAPVGDEAVDAAISFAVFQHLPDRSLTYGYVAEIGRVLRPGGWTAFQVSNDPSLHQRGSRRRDRKGGARSYHHPAWWGSYVEIDELTQVAAQSGLEIDRVVDEGSLFCLVRGRKA